MPYGTVDPNISRPDINPADRNNLAIKAGYTGYEDYLSNSATTQPGAGMTSTTPTIDLPSLYKNITDSSGIGGLQTDLSSKERAYNETISKINDNPFLSEANRVGRIQKLTTDYTNLTANLRNDITTKKADIETQLNLQTKQFDINSEQARRSFDQFQSLLSNGSLNNASSADIANLTRSTGLSSSIIQSAIQANKDKSNPVTMKEYDDGTNQGIAVIDSKGNIVNRQVIAPSKPDKSDKTTEKELTPTKKEEVIKSSRKILTGVDKNKDKLVSAQEYIDAVKKVMMDKQISEAQADEYVAQAMKELKFNKWKW